MNHDEYREALANAPSRPLTADHPLAEHIGTDLDAMAHLLWVESQSPWGRDPEALAESKAAGRAFAQAMFTDQPWED